MVQAAATGVVEGNKAQKNLKEIKVMIVGDSCSGKTALLHRYSEGYFSDDLPMVQFEHTNLKYQSIEGVSLQG